MPAEQIFSAVAAHAWSDALDAAHADRSGSDLRRQAGQVLVSRVLECLEAPDHPPSDDDLEKLLLMQHAGYLEISEAGLDRIAETLVARNLAMPERAARFARYRPQAETCRAVLAQFGDRRRAEVAAPDGRITDIASSFMDGRRPVFRSDQERVLYLAARRRYPGSLLVPNAALSSAIRFEAVRGMLSGIERETFFRALVDLIVFDPDDSFLPTLFIELDSPWHDDPLRQERDRAKERMIGLAGGRLIRLRVSGQGDVSAMMRLLEQAGA